MESPKLALEVIQLWADVPQKEELYLTGQSVTIGEDANASFMLPADLVRDSFAFADHEEDAWVLRIPVGAIAEIEIEEVTGTRTIEIGTLPTDMDGVRLIRMVENMRVRIELGAFSFFARVTEPAPKTAASPFVQWKDHRWLAASGVAHLVFLAALFFSPPRAGALVLDLNDRELDRIRITLEGVEQEQREREQLAQDQVGESGAEGAPMAGESGASGAVNETRHTGGGVQARGPSNDRQIPLTAQQVLNMNTLASLSSLTSSMSSISSPFGLATALGSADQDAYGDLMNAIPGFGPGAGGFGMRGIGRGGCTAGDQACLAGAVGVGGIQGIGHGHGCDEEQFARYVNELGRAAAMDRCSGVGTGIGLGDRMTGHHRVPNGIGGVPTTSGGLSREDIRRVVQRHLPEVRHCYEQALMSRPDLEGRVSERFVIQPDGRVQGVQMADSSIHSPDVENCVTQAVGRWSFPQTDSPTIVTYPFSFMPAN